MINHYFGGNISQDRLMYYIHGELFRNYYKPPETDLGHGWGLGRGEETAKALSWALNNATATHVQEMPTFDQVRAWIDSNRPIMRLSEYHMTIVDGYTTNGQLVHVIDPLTGTESAIAYSELAKQQWWSWIPQANATARNDEPEIWQDSDNDGMVDFDEKNRFFTDSFKSDTDGDGIDDKTEIRSYTFLSNDTFDSEDMRKPDADNDGLRAELDWDSDNGGTPDGLEDLNHNGKLDPGETDPLNPEDDPYTPPPVALFEYTPEKPWATKTVTFNASASYSPKGNITTYEWNFGDKNTTTVTELIINHAYALPGEYNVILKVTDNNTLRNTTTKTITAHYITDSNKDGTVNILDISTVAKAYGSKPGDQGWSETADLNNDGKINILDISLVAKDYGKTV
jgi:hypothetical protein